MTIGKGFDLQTVVYQALVAALPGISMSQIADATQMLVRGYDLRMAYVDIHATAWNRGVLASVSLSPEIRGRVSVLG